MKIPLVEKLPPDIRIPKGPYRGQHRYYKTALWNTLIHLRPRICLEIGTWKGGSAKIFRRYFNKHCKDGILITADVKEYTNVRSRYVRQVRVYPHDRNVCETHHVSGPEMLLGWANHVDSSVEDNVAILRRELCVVDAKAFDFAFVDGDHWNILKDVEIVSQVVKFPGYALLDDTTAHVWPCSTDYQEQIKPRFNTYDFEDWDVFTGTSLVWEK